MDGLTLERITQPSIAPLLELLGAAIKEKASVRPCLLAFSGGTDSSVLAHAGAGFYKSAIILQTDQGGRDRVFAESSAKLLSIEFETLCVSEPDLLEMIERRCGLLRELGDYTQRILAVCELFLAERAASERAVLVTGHGPEAFLGGFRRHALPDPDRPEAMIERLRLNLDRLTAIGETTGVEIFTPFASENVRAELIALRRAGADKSLLENALSAEFSAPLVKSSLQNGSGVHYLFERIARARGFRRTRDAMEALLT